MIIIEFNGAARNPLDLEGNAKDETIAEALYALVLEDISVHLLPH